MIPLSDLLRICHEEASYLVYRKRVPLDVEDLTQDAAVIALEKPTPSPSLTRIIVRCGLRNRIFHYQSRPGGMRYAGSPSSRAFAVSLPSEAKTEDPRDRSFPEELRSYPDSGLGLTLSQIFARRAAEWPQAQHWDPEAFEKSSAAARFERVKAVASWYQKNRRKYDLFEGCSNAGLAG
mgnify:CR=1 FL=1